MTNQEEYQEHIDSAIEYLEEIKEKLQTYDASQATADDIDFVQQIELDTFDILATVKPEFMNP